VARSLDGAVRVSWSALLHNAGPWQLTYIKKCLYADSIDAGW
jgi:hypothetical protein